MTYDDVIKKSSQNFIFSTEFDHAHINFIFLIKQISARLEIYVIYYTFFNRINLTQMYGNRIHKIAVFSKHLQAKTRVNSLIR